METPAPKTQTPETADAFMARFRSGLTGGLWIFDLIVGERVGLISTLVSFNSEPKSSEEIATSTNLKERYVREWLNAGVAYDFVSCNEEGNKYWLTPERCEAIKTKKFQMAQAKGRTMMLQCAKILDQLLDCFKPDGPRGIPYSAYGNFTEEMGAFTAIMMSNTLIQKVAEIFPESVKEKLESGAKLLDVACGVGKTTLLWAKAFPKSTIVGFDFLPEAVKIAQEDAERQHISNATYFTGDALCLADKWSNQFDVVTIIKALHDISRPDKCLSEAYKVLKPGGFLCVIEAHAHSNPYLDRGNPETARFYTMSMFHCLPVSMYFHDGAGLGNCWGQEKAEQMLTDTGFSVVTTGHDAIPSMMHFFAFKK